MSAQCWEVVGSGSGGGILVRTGRELDSPSADLRLSKGALVEELELKGERLHYWLLQGRGPSEGWVSLKNKGTVLVEKTDKKPKDPNAKPPSWLRPDGGKKLLFLSMPWKGHIIHLKRIAEWFDAFPGYQIGAAVFPGCEDVFPKSAKLYHMRDDEAPASQFMATMEDGFRKLAIETRTYEEGTSGIMQVMMKELAVHTERGEDPWAMMMRFYLRALVEDKPDIVIGDAIIQINPMVQCYCKMENITVMAVHSPGIPETFLQDSPDGMISVKKLTEEDLQVMAKAMKIPVEMIKMGQGLETISPERMQEVMMKVPRPADMVILALFESWRNGDPSVAPFMITPIAKKLGLKPKTVSSLLKELPNLTPAVLFYPASSALLSAYTLMPPDIFTGPFLPLPQALESGAVQRDRANFEATLAEVKPDLLEWLYGDEAARPIVYMAFGSIVRPNEEIMRKLVEGLDGGEWRVLWALPETLHGMLPAGLAEKKQAWRIETFVPQADVLKCDRVRCFISHNGSNSTVESLACGVPMVCMPFYMDQFDWAKLVCQHRKAGIQVDKFGPASELREAVTRVVGEPCYRDAAQAASTVMRTQERLILERLGPAMVPRSKVAGSGVSVVAAIILAILKQQDAGLVWQWVHSAMTAAVEADQR